MPGKVAGGYYYWHRNKHIDELIVAHDPKLNFGAGGFTIDAWVAFPVIKGKPTSSSGPPGSSATVGPPAEVIFSKHSYGFRIDQL